MISNYKTLQELEKKNKKLSRMKHNENLLKEGKIKIEILMDSLKNNERR